MAARWMTDDPLPEEVSLLPDAEKLRAQHRNSSQPVDLECCGVATENEGYGKEDTPPDPEDRHDSPTTERKPTSKPKTTAKPEPIDEYTIAEQPITTAPPGGLTENSPGQTERVKRILENVKAARDATRTGAG